MTKQKSFNPDGRPPLYRPDEADKLSEIIEDYFNKCDIGEDIEQLTKRGDLVKYNRKIPYTVEELCLALGMTRETLGQYAKKPAFSDIILRAKQKIYASWIKNGLLGDYNPKMASLCLAANTKVYNIKQETDVTVLTIEDKLREAKRQARLEEHVPEAEIIETKVIEDKTE